MKVELVKVKISKFRQVKRQLRRGKNKNQKNLKNLLIGEDKAKRENDILYKSINALFQDDNINNEAMNTTYSENLLPVNHFDLDEFLQSLQTCKKDISPDESSNSVSTLQPNSSTDETVAHSVDPTTENCNIDSLTYTIYNDNEGTYADKIYLYNQIETESILWCSSSDQNFCPTVNMNDTNTSNFTANGCIKGVNDINFNTSVSMDGIDNSHFYATTNMNDTGDTNLDDMFINENLDDKVNLNNDLEPAMIELRQYYKPDTELITTEMIKQEGFNNETEISTNEMSEVKQHAYEIQPYELILPDKEGNILVDPQAVNSSGVDLKVITMSQIQNQRYDATETDDVADMELLKNYNLEQRTNIIAAAQILYTKRTRTLLHWLDPKLPLTKLKPTLVLSWKNLPTWQKEVYVSQVLGPLMVDTVSPMINPQLTPGGYVKVEPKLADKMHYKRRHSSTSKSESQINVSAASCARVEDIIKSD